MVFRVPVSGGTPAVLASFNGSNGKQPYAGLVLSGNTLYGTTVNGGANGYGTIFSVPMSGGSPTVHCLVQWQQRCISHCRFDAQRRHLVRDDLLCRHRLVRHSLQHSRERR